MGRKRKKVLVANKFYKKDSVPQLYDSAVHPASDWKPEGGGQPHAPWEQPVVTVVLLGVKLESTKS